MGSEKVYQVNLEELIEDYTWRCYKKDCGFFKRLFLRRNDYIFDIRWGYIDFKHVTNPDKKKTTENKPTASPGTAKDDQDDKTESEVDTAMKVPNHQVKEADKKDIELYYSEYENRTGKSQRYTFTASRQTTTTTRVEMQENYTLGATTNLEVNFAEIVKIGAELSASYSVTETKAEEFSKSLTWDINTEIIVPSWKKARASLYVYEIPSKSNFVVKTTMRLPSGQLPVTIREAKDGKEIHTEWINDLGILFDQDYKNRSSVEVVEELVVMENGDQVMENQIVLTTRGVCRNVSFKNQHVKVECETLPGSIPADLVEDKGSNSDDEGEDGGETS